MIALNDLSRQTSALRDRLDAAITRVCDRGWYINGPEVAAFEKEFATFCGGGFAVGVGNGTDAIELALRAIGVGPGDEVVVAANAGMYAVTALRAIGARPAFADVDARSLVMTAETARAAMSPATKAIIVTHLYGRMAAMPALRALSEQSAVALVEDCAQSHGARQDGIAAGAWGDVGCFSFYPTKNLGAIGDGGLALCRDLAVAERLRRLRQYGWQQKYVSIDGPARNSRLDELQAAVLRAKLPLLDGWNTRRRKIARSYASIEHPQLLHPDVSGEDYVAHLYVLRTPRREALRAHLERAGIASEIHYPLLDTQQPVLGEYRSRRLANSEAAVSEILTLPCYPELVDEEVASICHTLASWKG